MSFQDHYQVGLNAARAKEWEYAVEELEQAIELEDDHPDALCLLGACYGQLKRYLEAEHYLSMACEMAPKMAQAHYNLGRTFHARERIEDAIRSYENALRANRDYAPARAALEALHVTLSPDLRDSDTEVHPGEEPAAQAGTEVHSQAGEARRTP